MNGDRSCGFLRTNKDCSCMGFAEFGYSISNIQLTSKVNGFVVRKDRSLCKNMLHRNRGEIHIWGILAFLTLDLSFC